MLVQSIDSYIPLDVRRLFKSGRKSNTWLLHHAIGLAFASIGTLKTAFMQFGSSKAAAWPVVFFDQLRTQWVTDWHIECIARLESGYWPGPYWKDGGEYMTGRATTWRSWNRLLAVKWHFSSCPYCHQVKPKRAAANIPIETVNSDSEFTALK